MVDIDNNTSSHLLDFLKTKRKARFSKNIYTPFLAFLRFPNITIKTFFNPKIYKVGWKNLKNDKDFDYLTLKLIIGIILTVLLTLLIYLVETKEKEITLYLYIGIILITSLFLILLNMLWIIVLISIIANGTVSIKGNIDVTYVLNEKSLGEEEEGDGIVF